MWDTMVAAASKALTPSIVATQAKNAALKLQAHKDLITETTSGESEPWKDLARLLNCSDAVDAIELAFCTHQAVSSMHSALEGSEESTQLKLTVEPVRKLALAGTEQLVSELVGSMTGFWSSGTWDLCNFDGFKLNHWFVANLNKIAILTEARFSTISRLAVYEVIRTDSLEFCRFVRVAHGP